MQSELSSNSQETNDQVDEALLNSPIAKAETQLAQVESSENAKEHLIEMEEIGKELIEEKFGSIPDQ